jgi:hypothetical protein
VRKAAGCATLHTLRDVRTHINKWRSLSSAAHPTAFTPELRVLAMMPARMAVPAAESVNVTGAHGKTVPTTAMSTTEVVNSARSAMDGTANRSDCSTRRRRWAKVIVTAKISVTRITGCVCIARVSRTRIRNHIESRSRFVFRFSIDD